MKTLFHWLGFHKWGPWKDAKAHVSTDMFGDYDISIQEHYCEICNKMKWRKV